jgi:hypothetical protein
MRLSFMCGLLLAVDCVVYTFSLALAAVGEEESIPLLLAANGPCAADGQSAISGGLFSTRNGQSRSSLGTEKIELN